MWPFKQKSKSLTDAVREENLREVRRLLKAGADPNAIDPNDDCGPINYSIHSTPEIVQLLIDHGANVNVSARGSTPLAMAEALGITEIAAILRRAGAQVRGAEDDLSIDPRERIRLQPMISELVYHVRRFFPSDPPETIADKVEAKLNLEFPPMMPSEQRAVFRKDVRELILRECRAK